MAGRDIEEKQATKLKIESYADQKFEQKQDEEWTVMFNPAEYAFTRANKYLKTQSAGTSKPATGYGYGEPDKLEITLLMDGTGVVGEPGPVTDRVKAFLDLMKYKGDKHKPRYLRLSWGALDFRCFLKSATVTFTLFNRDGEPIRAKVAAEFEEVMDDKERVGRERSASPDLFRSHRVGSDDRLDLIAYEAYGDVSYWRALAEINDLSTPTALVPGSVLILPPVER